MTPEGSAESLIRRLREGLRSAIRSRDASAAAALRSALAAIENAEAVDAAAAPPSEPGVIAGGVRGLGRGEVQRRPLDAAEALGILEAEVAEREAAAGDYERAGREAEAGRLRAEAALLRKHLP